MFCVSTRYSLWTRSGCMHSLRHLMRVFRNLCVTFQQCLLKLLHTHTIGTDAHYTRFPLTYVSQLLLLVPLIK